MTLTQKISLAISGSTVYIYPCDLTNYSLGGEEPITVADLISLCDSYNLEYLIIDSPQSFKIFTNVSTNS